MRTTLAKLSGAILLAMALLVGQSVAVNAATVVGQINGGGTSIMTDGMGVTSFAIHATLFSDGTATGRIDCVDRVGSAPEYPGNIYGAITRWARTPDGIALYVADGRLIGIPGGPVISGGVPFVVTIQRFGGAGVGHWTLDVPAFEMPTPICVELLTSGQIAVRWR